MAIDPYASCHLEIQRSNCTLETCCLAQSSFLYRPCYGGNVFFTLFFAAFILPHVGLGLKYKTWGYSIGVVLGVTLEFIGYNARVELHKNPFSDDSFLVYLIALTIAPVFVTAAIYLCLSRIIVLYGEHLSFFQPRTLAVGFMISDTLSLILQAVGGGMAETAHKLDNNLTPGIDTMIAGLLLQAISLSFFLFAWGLFMCRAWRGLPDQSTHKTIIRQRGLFHAFSGGLLASTLAILIRSIYRVVELWGGFTGELWNNEKDFMILDGAMLASAVVLLTVLHPGPAFDGQWNTANWSFRGKEVARNHAAQLPGGTAEKEMELWQYRRVD